MKKIQAAERRLFIRLKAYHLAKYRFVSGAENPPPYLNATIKNLGGGGACLVIASPVPVSSVLELKISFPSLLEPIVTTAKVVRIRKLSSVSVYEAGVQFVNLEEFIRKVIDERAKSIHRQLS